MEFQKLIKTRQSCRNFSDKPVSKDLLYKIIETASNSPSACNSQPWRVLVTNTPEENAKMKKCLQNGGRNSFLDNAKAFIAVYSTEKVTLKADVESKFSLSHFVKYDIGEFVAYLTLAAQDNGLDSCIIGWVNNEEINETFSINGKCDIVVALGFAADDKIREKSRKNLEQIIINYKE